MNSMLLNEQVNAGIERKRSRNSRRNEPVGTTSLLISSTLSKKEETKIAKEFQKARLG